MIILDDLLHASGGRLFGPPGQTEFEDFCFDSRRVEPGQLFLAVRTDKGDGHDYIRDAIRGGATGVLCQEPHGIDGYHVTCIVVPDTQRALEQWAAYILAKYGTEVIAVTGSVGKTGVKEALAAVLRTGFTVFSNHGSYNGLYGLPIALGKLRPEHRLAVLELGSDHPGEIARLAELTRPRVGIVTAVAANHLDTLGTLEQVAQEKGALLEALGPEGLAVLNGDDPLVRGLAGRTRARVVSVGETAGADLRAMDVQSRLDGTRFAVEMDGRSFSICMPWLGRKRITAALAALVVGLEYGLDLPAVVAELARLPWLAGRLNTLEGVAGSTLLDDTFNSSPAAALSALDFLAGVPVNGRKWAVLGDMYQLGARTEAAHRVVGERAAEVVDELVVKGELAVEIGRGAEAAGMDPTRVHYAFSSDEVLRHLGLNGDDKGAPSCLDAGDLVLVKGSARTRLERVVKALLADPERDGRKLVRQHPVFDQIVLALPGRPTWVEVDVEAAAHNTRRIKEMIGPTVILMTVLKADGYGHGAARMARVTMNNGAGRIGVASLNEAIALRDAGIASPIMILGYSPAWSARQAILNDVTVTLYDLEVAKAFNRAALDLGRPVTAHVKVDSGMGRLGLLPADLLLFMEQLAGLEAIRVEGVFTHFSVADSVDPQHLAHTDRQLEMFQQLLAQLETAGLRPPLAHCANSAAILTRPESYLDMVRLGLALHGLDPGPGVRCPPDFRRTLAFKTSVAQVKTVPAGTPVSYGNTYFTPRETRLAAIPVGYADGFRRAPSHWGSVLVRGQRAPIVGRVSMDQTMIDVSHIRGVRIGDEVVLIGRQGNDEITAEEVATNLGTINYEVVSGILARVPRIS